MTAGRFARAIALVALVALVASAACGPLHFTTAWAVRPGWHGEVPQCTDATVVSGTAIARDASSLVAATHGSAKLRCSDGSEVEVTVKPIASIKIDGLDQAYIPGSADLRVGGYDDDGVEVILGADDLAAIAWAADGGTLEVGPCRPHTDFPMFDVDHCDDRHYAELHAGEGTFTVTAKVLGFTATHRVRFVPAGTTAPN